MKMKQKHQYNTFHAIVNPNSIVQHAIQINNGIMINVNVSVKTIKHAKKIMIGILANVFVKIANI